MSETTDLYTLRSKSLEFWLYAASLKPIITLHLKKKYVFEISLIASTIVHGRFKGLCDQGNALALDDLQTPLGIVPDAKIRMDDVEYLSFPLEI